MIIRRGVQALIAHEQLLKTVLPFQFGFIMDYYHFYVQVMCAAQQAREAEGMGERSQRQRHYDTVHGVIASTILRDEGC